jgi:hypothetical protein
MMMSRFWRIATVVVILSGMGAFAVAMVLSGNPDGAKLGFLVLGGFLTVIATLSASWLQRPVHARDLAHALHIELADRVARCCFDFEKPWRQFADAPNPTGMDATRLLRFAPIPPVIYPAVAPQLAMLHGSAAQSIIQFYFRLAAWQRDVELTAARYGTETHLTTVSGPETKRLGRRLRETLRPGLNALNAVAPMVSDAETMEAAAIAHYDAAQPKHGEYGSASLRDRIKTQLQG